MNLVSVIIAVYNVENYLRQCIKSVICQTYCEIEIILVDDGSTDSSGLICDELAEFDDRIKVLHKINGGLSDARNAGLLIATGDYVVFVDGDDVVSDRYVECLSAPLISGRADLSVCDADLIDDPSSYDVDASNELNTLIEESSEALINAYLMNGINLSAWGKMASRDLWMKHPFPKGRVYEDLSTMPGVFSSVKLIAHVVAPLYGQVMRTGSITRQSTIKKSQFLEYYKASEDALSHALETKNDRVIAAGRFRQLITYARMKRIYLSLESIDDETVKLHEKISHSLKEEACEAVRKVNASPKNIIALYLAAYAMPLYDLLFKLLQLIRRIKR